MTRFAKRADFHNATRTNFTPDFSLHSRVAEALLPFVLHERRVSAPCETALDFLLIQAYKAHDAVAVLAENGLIEDAATVTRRLMEVGIQAVYIGADSEIDTCNERGGRYLSYLWREMPAEAKAHLNAAATAHWTAMAAKYGAGIHPRAKQWGPKVSEMFEYAERRDTYDQDYSLLSQVAHGSPEEFILHYSAERFPLRSTLHLPAVMKFASRYYVATADIWNRHFRLISAERLKEITNWVLNEDTGPAT